MLEDSDTQKAYYILLCLLQHCISYVLYRILARQQHSTIKADEKLELGDTVILGSQNKACTICSCFCIFHHGWLCVVGGAYHYLVLSCWQKMELWGHWTKSSVVSCCCIGNTRFSHHYASCHEQSWRRQH